MMAKSWVWVEPLASVREGEGIVAVAAASGRPVVMSLLVGAVCVVVTEWQCDLSHADALHFLKEEAQSMLTALLGVEEGEELVGINSDG